MLLPALHVHQSARDHDAGGRPEDRPDRARLAVPDAAVALRPAVRGGHWAGVQRLPADGGDQFVGGHAAARVLRAVGENVCGRAAVVVCECYFVECRFLVAFLMLSLSRSLQEVLFNAFACFGYLTSASYMAYTVMLWLYPRFLLQPAYMAYPAMTGVYYIATLTGIVHGADAYGALRAYRNARHR